MELFNAGHIKADSARVYFISDAHIGAENFDEKHFCEVIEKIKNDDGAIAVGVGDLLQNDIISSVGGPAAYKQKIAPSEQKYYARDLLSPLGDKLKAMMGGNHDGAGGRTKEDNTPIRDICEFLGVHYCDAELSFRISVGGNGKNKPIAYSGYGIHGYASGRLSSSPALMLERLPNVADADFYFAGHTHMPITFSNVWFRRDLHNNNMIPVQRIFVGCGSFQGREVYPVKLALTPKVMGCSVLHLSGIKKDMWCELPRSIHS